jgi:hypothetical protein
MMARVLEKATLQAVQAVLNCDIGTTPDWLQRPGKEECGRRWKSVCKIYNDLTGLQLSSAMPPRERRTIDGVLEVPGQPPRLFEFDETQHFNNFRARTLRMYPRTAQVAFPQHLWIQRSEQKKRLEGGGFGRPCPPLFPGDGGRHRQRAFRDTLADLLPMAYGWAPTLRIADFEVKDWIQGSEAPKRMAILLEGRIDL